MPSEPPDGVRPDLFKCPGCGKFLFPGMRYCPHCCTDTKPFRERPPEEAKAPPGIPADHKTPSVAAPVDRPSPPARKPIVWPQRCVCCGRDAGDQAKISPDISVSCCSACLQHCRLSHRAKDFLWSAILGSVVVGVVAQIRSSLPMVETDLRRAFLYLGLALFCFSGAMGFVALVVWRKAKGLRRPGCCPVSSHVQADWAARVIRFGNAEYAADFARANGATVRKAGGETLVELPS